MKPIIANSPRNMLAKKEQDCDYTIPDYNIDLENQNDSHSILVKNALGSKRILDLGCGAGYIGKKIKDLQKCTVCGIELNTKTAKIASKTYDSVIIMQIGNQSDKNYQSFLRNKERFDCIICGDIIEHLPNPGEILAVLAKKLTKNGKILVSIPNIAHIDVIAGLIDGKFNYATCGILDRTHLRFWTEKSFYDFIRNINENYNLKLYPKIIAKTHLESSYYDSAALNDTSVNDCTTFQNIFELSISNKPIPKAYYPKNFQLISENLNKAINSQQVIQDLNRQIHDMENSTSWKITAPIRKIGKLLKH